MDMTTWGKTLIGQLIKQGVNYFCLAPGFRSAPLAIAAAETTEATTFIHFDERGLGFHALGVAKASKKPVAIIVTSGTAVGNLMPAVMEADSANIPLILLTCDRPHELRDTMANQTTDQIKIFGSFVRYFIDLPRPSDDLPATFLATTVARAVHRAKGPVQINCPFSEPFFTEKTEYALEQTPTLYQTPSPTLSKGQAKEWATTFQDAKKGVVILGAGGGSTAAQDLALKLGWPIFSDILSGVREMPHEADIPFYHHIVKNDSTLQAEIILHFGNPFVSKPLLQWIDKQKGAMLVHVAEHEKRCDPLHRVEKRVVCNTAEFSRCIYPFVEAQSKEWLLLWKEASLRIKSLIATLLNSEHLSEPMLPKIIDYYAKTTECALFFANSMPIRDADMFFHPESACGPIFANRGLSGIDGNIATCCGIAQLHPVLAVMGDQTVLHDLNSLSQLKKTRYPVKLIIINNGGGGIFSFVETRKKKELIESFFAAAHPFEFSHAASLFDLPYSRATTKEELLTALNETGPHLVEVTTNREDNYQLHQEIDKEIQACISFSTAS